MLKQEFQQFRVSKYEGIHKGYDRFQKILSQLNQLQAKPDNGDCNATFLGAFPSLWSQVVISLKTKGGLDYLNFDDLYNKLRSLEVNVKGGFNYSSIPSHAAFVSTTTNRRPSLPNHSSNASSSYTTRPHYKSCDVVQDVLDSFVAETNSQ